MTLSRILYFFSLIRPGYKTLRLSFRSDFMRFFLYLLIGVSLSSCTKSEEGDFKLSFIRPFRIDAGSGTLLTYVIDMDVPTGWTSFLKANGLTNANIDRVSPRSLTISPQLGNGISYKFVEDVRVYIQDPAKPSSKIQIGRANPLPNEREGNLYLFPGIADLKDYFMLPQVKIYVEFIYRDLITNNSDHQIEMQFNIFKK